ncbi:hypothetical protein [uncultured Tolumonas sp.]|uniref:hypothetical protein n=1 Tax=uncultured Tolumonas sp. TaxID=263765 RepID=UPI00292FA836|nr:hypothetical protein [uncultured Tolumonas sp.]
MSKNSKATSAPKFIQLQPFDTATQIINSFTIPERTTLLMVSIETLNSLINPNNIYLDDPFELFASCMGIAEDIRLHADEAEQVLCDKVRALTDDQYNDLFNTCFSFWGWENKSAMEFFFANSETDPVSPLLRRALCANVPKMAATIPAILR